MFEKKVEGAVFNSHNPYFSRWFSAIQAENHIKWLIESHNPYFSRWFSAMKNALKNVLL